MCGSSDSGSMAVLLWQFFDKYYLDPSTDTRDFIPFSTHGRTVTAANDIAIQLFSRNDDITLEYDDTVILRFIVNPGLAGLIQQLEAVGEYIRDTATVNIIDSDRKYLLLLPGRVTDQRLKCANTSYVAHLLHH